MILQCWIHATLHFPKPTECTTWRVNSIVNYELWVIMVSQCRFFNWNQSTILEGDVDNGVSHACTGQEVYRIYMYFPLSFTVNLKLLFKKCKKTPKTNKFTTFSNVIQLQLLSSNKVAIFLKCYEASITGCGYYSPSSHCHIWATA